VPISQLLMTMMMILFFGHVLPSGVLGRAHDAGGHSYTIYSYLQLIKSYAKESLVAETCVWFEGKEKEKLPIGESLWENNPK
jgi:Glycosyl transferases, related to UDP-glucuronosyltransferase